MIGTSKPYIGAMRGTVLEPQANLGANQKFSPIYVFFLKKGGDKPWNFNGLIKHQNDSIAVTPKWSSD